MGVVKKQGVLTLETHDALMASNKLLSNKIEAQKVTKLSKNGVSCDFYE